MRVAGQRQCPPKCAYYCGSCVSGSVRFIAYGGMKSLQSQKARGASLCTDTESSSLLFPFALRWSSPHVVCFCQHYGCMHVWLLSTCSSSLCSHDDLYPNQRAICPSINPLPLRCWGEKVIPRDTDLETWGVSKWCHGRDRVLNAHINTGMHRHRRETSTHQNLYKRPKYEYAPKAASEAGYISVPCPPSSGIWIWRGPGIAKALCPLYWHVCVILHAEEGAGLVQRKALASAVIVHPP